PPFAILAGKGRLDSSHSSRRNTTMHSTKRFRVLLLGLFAAALLAGTPWSGLGQDSKPAPNEPPKDRPKKPGELKKYAEVLPPDKTRTSPGVFTVHRVDDKVFYEIPAEAYGKLMLWSTEVAKAPSGVGWGGSALGHHAVRWDRRGNKVYLWQVSFEKQGDGKAIQRAVDSATMGSIVMAFNVEAEGRDRAAVIDATPLLTTDVPEFSARGRAGAGASVDSSRSYVEETKAFPTNIEVRSLLTFRSLPVGGGVGPGGPSQAPAGPGRSVSILVHYSMTLLPEKPM